MAVKRLIGKVDQIEIVFERMEGDLWQVQVPGDEDCTYILELYAADEAGNETFMTRIFFMYDVSKKTVILKPIPYKAILSAKTYYGSRILNEKGGGRMLKVKFDIGEERHVRVEITSEAGGEFQIRDATYELLTEDESLEAEGRCVVDDHVIDAYICPLTAGMYTLKYIYLIGDETWIEPVRVVVS